MATSEDTLIEAAAVSSIVYLVGYLEIVQGGKMRVTRGEMKHEEW